MKTNLSPFNKQSHWVPGKMNDSLVQISSIQHQASTHRETAWPKRVLHRQQETTEDGHGATAASPNFCTQPGHCGVTFCTCAGNSKNGSQAPGAQKLC